MEIEEKQKTFSLNFHNRLEKSKNDFSTFPQPVLLDQFNEKGKPRQIIYTKFLTLPLISADADLNVAQMKILLANLR